MITIDTLDEIFSVTQNDMQQMVAGIKQEFNAPETDRQTVKMWIEMPLMLKEAITAKNPKLAKRLNDKASKLQGGK